MKVGLWFGCSRRSKQKTEWDEPRCACGKPTILGDASGSSSFPGRTYESCPDFTDCPFSYKNAGAKSKGHIFNWKGTVKEWTEQMDHLANEQKYESSK